ncbi:hypothetical protein OROGR_030536 [Orobanche gracilis]
MTVDKCFWRRHISVVDSFFGNGSVVESLMVDLSSELGADSTSLLFQQSASRV